MAAEKAVKRSVLRVLGLLLLTGGIYVYYWFFVTKNQLKQELGTNDNVGLQTVGLIVPILNAFIIYWLYRDINAARAKKNLETFPAGWYIAIPYILGGIAFALVIGTWVGVAGDAADRDLTGTTVANALAGTFLVVLLALAAIITHYVLWGVAISKLNQYWDKVGGTAAKFGKGEIAVIVVGLLFLIMNASSGGNDSYDEEQVEQDVDKTLQDAGLDAN